MSSLQRNKGSIALFSRAMRAASWLHGLPGRITPAPLRLVQIGAAFWQSRALYVAARLDIATIIGDASLSADEIAMRVSAQSDPLSRLLRMLVALGVFERTSAGRFRNNAVSNHLRQDEPRNVRAMILMHNSHEMTRPWCEELERGIVHGTPPFELAHGADLYAYMEEHADFDSLFSRAMDAADALVGDSFAVDFDWSRFERVIDLGGSKGRKAIAILNHHPHLRAVVVDRERVIRDARVHWRDKADPALLARLEYRAGDVLRTIPPATTGGDVFFLSAVLHGFDDATSAVALRNVAAAAGDTGARIVLLECVLDEERPALAEVLSDMQMLMGTRGRERTLRQWLALFELGGVALEEVVDLRSFAKLLVLRPSAAVRHTLNSHGM